MLPYVNATLTAVTAVGASEDYDSTASTGSTRWTGSVGVYVAEQDVETLSPDRVDEVIQTRIEIPYDIGRLVERGDTLTYTYEGGTVRRVAGTITHAPLVGRVRVLPENA